MLPLSSRLRLYWLLQTGGWLLYGVLGVIIVSVFGKFQPVLIGVEAIVAGTLLVSSHLLRGYIRRHGWARLPLKAVPLRLLLALLVVTFGSMVVIAGLNMGLFMALRVPAQSQGFPWVQYVGYTLNTFFVLCMWPVYVERAFEAYRAYFDYLPKGRHVIEYTVRLNNPGRFKLPQTRVEAMYAPESFGELPNAAVEVGP